MSYVNVVKFDALTHGQIDYYYSKTAAPKLIVAINDISERIGYCIPLKQYLILIDENINDSDDLMRIQQAIIDATGVHKWDFVCDRRSSIYSHFQSYSEILGSNSAASVTSSADVAVEQETDALFVDALKIGVTDIHISITEDPQAKIYFRDNGTIDTTPILKSSNEAMAIIGNMFEYSGASNTKTDFSPDKDNSTSVNKTLVVNGVNFNIEVRVEYRSMKKTDKVCAIRLITGSAKFRSLDDLGLPKKTSNIFRSYIQQTFGLILFSGPTGAGKSTTMGAIIKEKPKASIVHTLENPIEEIFSDPLIFQGNRSDNIAEDLASFMRLDLNIGVVSEMRFLEEISLAMNLARTGHLLLSSIHATDSLGIVDRLVKEGVSRAELSERNLLRLLTGQRLVPILCPHCKRKIDENDIERMAIIADDSALTRIREHKSKIHRINHDGCEHCRGKGTKGRKLVLEYTVVDDTARKYIYNGDSVAWVESLHKRGWKSMADSSWDFILSGNFDAEIAETEVPGVLASSMEWQY